MSASNAAERLGLGLLGALLAGGLLVAACAVPDGRPADPGRHPAAPPTAPDGRAMAR
ncbi:hypothetical protein ACFVGY_23015 [Streptomyces sp. NPDC127106]|uniref:hypothetical protein n=1 Tax=Streptomyces sp. NPDC127106 TaxID=3345360 RepID=UPI00363EB236